MKFENFYIREYFLKVLNFWFMWKILWLFSVEIRIEIVKFFLLLRRSTFSSGQSNRDGFPKRNLGFWPISPISLSTPSRYILGCSYETNFTKRKSNFSFKFIVIWCIISQGVWEKPRDCQLSDILVFEILKRNTLIFEDQIPFESNSQI